MSEALGYFEGSKSGGSFFFYPVASLPLVSSSIHITEYAPPVGWGVEDWYIAQEHKPTHSGLDINLNEYPYGDVDLGEPLFIVCNGLVIYADLAPGYYWGNVVITISVDDLGLLFWRYGHLDRIDVEAGQFVSPGIQVGTCGKGYNGRYDAHLHLDCWRGGMLAANAWLDRSVEWVDPLTKWAKEGFSWKWGKR